MTDLKKKMDYYMFQLLPLKVLDKKILKIINLWFN